MEKTVHELAKLADISVRTLHHYDSIGLLPPSRVTNAGYRLYDETSIQRLKQILFFRELDFPLKEIKQILDHPSFDKTQALKAQRELLLLKRQRLDCLISTIDQTLKGELTMNFNAFSMQEIKNAKEKYASEVRERWGNTTAYAEAAAKTNNRQLSDWEQITAETNAIFQAFADNMDFSPSSLEVQKLVAQWQEHITQNYYNCTDEILAGLGELYIEDKRFTENIDKCREGLAAFISEAIRCYCRQ